MGDIFGPGSDVRKVFGPYEYFIMMFPNRQLKLMVELTNAALRKAGEKVTSGGEALKFLGIVLLCTRFEFGKRNSLWSESRKNPFLPAPCFGRTGMSRNRFNLLWSHVEWSKQAATRPATQSSVQYRWRRVADFVKNFNEHREKFFVPSDFICVDE